MTKEDRVWQKIMEKRLEQLVELSIGILRGQNPKVGVFHSAKNKVEVIGIEIGVLRASLKGGEKN